jgi:hypothetical protein
MKDLIKKILKEYFTSEIKIEVIGWYSSDLLEELIKNSNLLLEVRPDYIYPASWNTAVKTIDTYLKKPSNNPIKTSFIDNNAVERRGTLNIKPSDHYIERLFRTDDPKYKPGEKEYDPNIVDPGLLEGLQLIKQNSSTILKAIMSTKNPHGLVLKVSTTTKDYTMIITVSDEKKSKFDLNLVTQIKGTQLRNVKLKNPKLVSVNPIN